MFDAQTTTAGIKVGVDRGQETEKVGMVTRKIQVGSIKLDSLIVEQENKEEGQAASIKRELEGQETLSKFDLDSKLDSPRDMTRQESLNVDRMKEVQLEEFE